MKKLSPTDIFDLIFLRSARLSPEGKHVIAAASSTEENERFELWLMDVAGASRQKIPFSGNAASPSWSPDGESIAFVGDGRLYLYRLSSSEFLGPLTPDGVSIQGRIAWSPDGSRIALSLRQVLKAPSARQVTQRHFRADGLGFTDGIRQSIHILELASDSLRDVTPGCGICTEPEWNKTGREILFLASSEAVPFASYSPRLLCLDVEAGLSRDVLGDGWYITQARWLPDGHHLLVAGAWESSLTVPQIALWTLRSDGSQPECRTSGASGTLGFRIHHDMPCWGLTQEHVLEALNQEVAYATVQIRGRTEIWRIALQGPPRYEPIACPGSGSSIILDVNEATDTLLYAQTDFDRPPELYRCMLSGAEPHRLTAFNDETLKMWPSIRAQEFAVTSWDGLGLDAWSVSASSVTGPAPTVLFIHGGPYIATGRAFRYDFWMLASHGFRIVFANFRGSAGYGEEFARAISGDWGSNGFPDHMAVLDEAISLKLADPARLGVWGPSHGGFATCWIVGHTQRFKAAVAEAAFTNWETVYYLTDAPDGFERELGGKPQALPELCRVRSPLTFAKNCRTPTLLIHGEEDLRCPVSEAEQFFRSLQDARCPSELLRIAHCAHLGDSAGPLSARQAQNEGLLSWFLRYLN